MISWENSCIARFLPSLFGGANGTGDKCDEGPRGNRGKPVAFDLRLSTAVSMSARSPVVSPHANLRDRSQQIVDSAVDGGYFDNSGAVTAVEIARALKAVDRRLRPFVVQVSSEPEWFPDRCQQPQNSGAAHSIARRPKPQDEADFKPLGTFGNLLTVNATRVARAFETMVETPEQMRQWLDNGGGLELARELYGRYNVFFVGGVWYGAESLVSKKPIRKLTDFKGVKIRAPQGIGQDIFQILGSAPVNLPGSEVYTALERGVVDASDWGTLSMNQDLGYHKLAPYPIYQVTTRCRWRILPST